jgi:hypothetical protein
MTPPTYVPEYLAIVDVLNKYNEGNKQAESQIMKPVFNDNATMFSVGSDGKLTGGAIQRLYDAVDADFRPSPEARAVIVSIDIVGTVASARIDTNDIFGFFFTDFFHLLKVDGAWTIISKIYYAHPVG